MGALLLLLACLWLWFIKMWNWLAMRLDAYCFAYCFLLVLACSLALSCFTLVYYFSTLLFSKLSNFDCVKQTLLCWCWLNCNWPTRPRPTRPNQKKTKRQMPKKFKHLFLFLGQTKLVKVGSVSNIYQQQPLHNHEAMISMKIFDLARAGNRNN
jgi:hypothetical protein